MKKQIFLFFVLTFVFISYAAAFNIRVDIRKVELKITSGDSSRGGIIVENPTEDEILVKAYLEDFSYIAPHDGAKKFFPPGSTEYSCAKWITFSPQEFRLAPFSKQKVSYTVSVPEAARGGHYAVLFFETALGEVPDNQGANILVLGRIGSLFLINTDESIKQAELINLSTKTKAIEAGLHNTGNTILTAKGSFYIMNNEGKVFDRGKITDIYLSPGDNAEVSLPIGENVPAGSYTLMATFDLEGGDILVKEIDFYLGPGGILNISAIRD